MGVRLGIISDAHGNASALQECMSFFHKKGVEQILFLGDAVGYFPHCAEVCEMLVQAKAICLKGNHEAMAFGELPLSPEVDDITGLTRTCGNLPEAWWQEVESRGSRLSLDIDGKKFLMVHGSPDAPLTGRVHEPEDLHIEEGIDVILMGHTHRPFINSVNNCLLLNPGSCGLPRDHGGLLSLAILDTEQMETEVYRIPFTLDDAILKQTHSAIQQCLARRSAAPFGTVWDKAI